MFDYLYEWIENVAFYLVILTIAIQLIPDNSYKKYIQFFVGLILVLMLSEPILKIFGMEDDFYVFYENAEYEQKVKEIEKSTKYLEDISIETE